jgi:hypothetical protein
MNKRLNSAVWIGGSLFAGILAPGAAYGCACGCGMFDIGTSSMLPDGPGDMPYIEYAYQNQNRNWSGTSTAPAANNDDKELATHFLTVGLQHIFNPDWGLQFEVPYDFRFFKGTDSSGNIMSHNWNQLGDIRLEGIYSGFFPDMSAGLIFGVKLPTGSHSEDPDLVDRDTQIGTGSTDLLLGGYYRGNLGKTSRWNWYGQALLQVPTLTQSEYRPGVEFNSAAGIYFSRFKIGHVRISPLGQALLFVHDHDSGANADPVNTGYERLILSPGLEMIFRRVRIYADAEFPVLQNFNGDQLAAPVMFKAIISYMF